LGVIIDDSIKKIDIEEGLFGTAVKGTGKVWQHQINILQ